MLPFDPGKPLQDFLAGDSDDSLSKSAPLDYYELARGGICFDRSIAVQVAYRTLI